MTTDLSPNYIAVDPDGYFRPVPPTFEGLVDGMHDATFDVVDLPDGNCLFVDDDGMLNGSRLNVAASLFAGRALFGTVVLTGGVDDEGETMCPTLHAANALMALAQMWLHVEADARRLGQDIAVIADADRVPPPEIRSFTNDEFERFLAERYQ